LDHNRLHHAYLFTGTRGVGKTTIARILAKCFNCEVGVSSEPCGVCSACTEIAEGRFIDLIEVDAASRTKVEDTRELLDNVQYAPTRGRYKVYLIDEVHMLSTHSFNALLKTLEEPPPHIKFLLATTDPQKLPATILSRCLQFNLKNMTPERIVQHLGYVLEQEMVAFEEPGLWLLGRAADGSMRDALSLTDQAIAFGSGKVGEADVRTMLGSIDQGVVFELLDALTARDGAALLAAVARVAEQATDFAGVLEEMLVVLHRIAIAHAVPDGLDNSRGDRERVLALAAQLTAEDAQLFYQIALNGRRDLPLSADPRSGLEMVLLRMLAFKPQGVPQPPRESLQNTVDSRESALAKKSEAPLEAPLAKPTAALVSNPASTASPAAPTFAAAPSPALTQPTRVVESPSSQSATPSSQSATPLAQSATIAAPMATAAAKTAAAAAVSTTANSAATPSVPVAAKSSAVPLAVQSFDNEVWITRFAEFGIGGVIGTIAAHCCLQQADNSQLYFVLDQRHASFFDQAHVSRITEQLSRVFGAPVQAIIETGTPQLETPAAYRERQRQLRLATARQTITDDPNVRLLQEVFGAVLEENSIEPLDNQR
ncbi:MAG TPA: DNA polymerase III subunit gamma/tau, partial [Spongiibacteraceae bacterium]|nr:DNA polymerase III subunit gamma/tau [Spongiibacteraceae bacterium]